MKAPTTTAEWIMWLVGVLVAGGVLKALLDIYMGRGDRKTKRVQGDAVLITTIHDVADKALKSASEVRAEFDSYRRRLDARLREHDRWDRRMVSKVEAATGESVEPPPPLYADDH